MARPIDIAHPLKNYTGLSQRTRLLDALNTLSAPVDGKTWSDWLFEISERAQHINFHRLVADGNNGVPSMATNWSSFFSNSLPFQLARISKIRVEDLKMEFDDLLELYTEHPTEGNLELVLLQIWDRLIVPVDRLYFMLDKAEHSFTEPLKRIVEASLAGPVKQYVRIQNAGNRFLCLCKKDFSLLSKSPWELPSGDLNAWSKAVREVQGGKGEALQKIGRLLRSIINQLVNGVGEIAALSAEHIQESLLPQREAQSEQHQPHVALMFTFLELYTHLKADLNSLGQKHLDFFYRQVLRMSPRGAVSDKAFLVFEISKHLNTHRLKSGTRVKNGKDNNQQDIVFGMEEELILDKAQVQEVRTLFLSTNEEDIQLEEPNENRRVHFVEGVYAAPVANSADGSGASFTEDQSKNWPTLGAKYSKTNSLVEGRIAARPHPHARIGFVLASPVLLLQEGKRRITIKIENCLPDKDSHGLNQFIEIVGNNTYILSKEKLNFEKENLSDNAFLYLQSKITNHGGVLEYQDEIELQGLLESLDKQEKQIFTNKDQNLIKESLLNTIRPQDKLFKVFFSGAEEWLAVEPQFIRVEGSANRAIINDNGTLQNPFHIIVNLPSEFPAITFFDTEILGENLDLSEPNPVAKIVLNENSEFRMKRIYSDIPECSLAKEKKNGEFAIASYHFLRKLKITNAAISVEVCGVKNLIVQNEESLQDVNKPIYPFGLRPKIGSHFYVGSKEVFYKNWQKFRLNLEWKDRPVFFETYYRAYNFHRTEDEAINDLSFEFSADVLCSGKWNTITPDNGYKLFDQGDTTEETDPITVISKVESSKIARYEYDDKSDKNKDGQVDQDWDFSNCFPEDYLNYEFSVSGISECELTAMLLESPESFETQSTQGFIRITLQEEDFQHDRYAKVLALNMAILNDPDKLNEWCTKLNPEEVDCTEVEEEMMGRMASTVTPEEFLPNEPYTPVIGHISLDYCAVVNKYDIELLHLGPFENTSKRQDIEELPTLVPDYEDEGNLFIGLSDIRPGGTLSLLFQLAEATADTETAKAPIRWEYLSGNEWKPLRTGFEIVNDGTDHLTQSGILKIALPNDINKEGNTLMPDHLYWIKASAYENVQTVAETIAIHTQAVQASARLAPLNDTNRFATALEAGSLAKLVTGDAGVNRVKHPYNSFNGRVSELSGPFYTRVGEQLRHKGRALAVHDYETLLLEAFPEIYKVKCIPHTLGLSAHKYVRDLEVAPGYVAIVVIPDLTKLQVGDQLKPKVPLGLLKRMEAYLKNRTSPFARLQIVNPRYEPVDVQIEVEFHPGKDETYYRAKLTTDISHFLAPWHLGDSEKLAFGQKLLLSDVIGFVERLEYLDHILDIHLYGLCEQQGSEIQTLTARSILTGGQIDVSVPPMENEESNENNLVTQIQ